jgi:hypothetical protein
MSLENDSTGSQVAPVCCARPQAYLSLRAAAQLDHFSLREKLGLVQCSQKAPEAAGKLKLRPDGSLHTGATWLPSDSAKFKGRGNARTKVHAKGGSRKIRPRLARPTYLELSASTVRVPKNCVAIFGRVAQQPNTLAALWPFRECPLTWTGSLRPPSRKPETACR